MGRLLRILILTLIATVVARQRRGPALPTWSFRFEWVVAFLRRDAVESARWPYARLRADLDARRYPTKALKRVARREEKMSGVPVVWFEPKDAQRGRAILYSHAGSYILARPGRPTRS